MRRAWLTFFVKLVCSFILLVLVLHSIEISTLWQIVGTTRIDLLFLAVCLFYPTQLFNTYRWYYLLRTLGGTASYGSMVRYSFLGQFTALFLPGQISGDIVRAMAIGYQQQEHARSLLSVILDKLSFLFAITLFALVGSLISPILATIPGLTLGAALICFLSLLGLTLFAVYRDARLLTWLLSRPWPIPAIFFRLLQRLTIIFDISRLSFSTTVFVLLCACGLQILNTIGSLVLAQAMHITISPLDWAAINGVVALVQVLPISIGGLGVREGAFVLLLSLYGVSQVQATAFSLTMFVLLIVLITLGWFTIEALIMWQSAMKERREKPVT